MKIKTKKKINQNSKLQTKGTVATNLYRNNWGTLLSQWNFLAFEKKFIDENNSLKLLASSWKVFGLPCLNLYASWLKYRVTLTSALNSMLDELLWKYNNWCIHKQAAKSNMMSFNFTNRLNAYPVVHLSRHCKQLIMSCGSWS